MAHIVKWCKHKILGGYNKFAVPECTTDTEELIYHQMRASSSCSAPPDLVLTSDRESNAPLLPGLGGAHAPGIAAVAPNKYTPHNTREIFQLRALKTSSSSNQTSNIKYNPMTPTLTVTEDSEDGCENTPAPIIIVPASAAAAAATADGKKRKQDKSTTSATRFEEVTCDISVESNSNGKPLQFSFKVYDLEDQHGKITKDDIAGIVYTIYETLGKTLTAAKACNGNGGDASKTINVRLTVGPNKCSLKQKQRTDAADDCQIMRGRICRAESGKPASKSLATPEKRVAEKRQHPTNHDSNHYDNTTQSTTTARTPKKLLAAQQQQQQQQRPKVPRKARKFRLHDVGAVLRQRSQSANGCAMEDEVCAKEFEGVDSEEADGDEVQLRRQTHTPPPPPPLIQLSSSPECAKLAMNRNELLSIIRESMEKNRLCFQQNGKPQANVSPTPQKQQTTPIATAAATSKHHHRARAYTSSRIPMLIPNHKHNNSSSNNRPGTRHSYAIGQELTTVDYAGSSIYHPQPHIPIYHQQLAISPAVQSNINAHNKINLCGYDSVLHAKMCQQQEKLQSKSSKPTPITAKVAPHISDKSLYVASPTQQPGRKHSNRQQRHKIQQLSDGQFEHIEKWLCEHSHKDQAKNPADNQTEEQAEVEARERQLLRVRERYFRKLQRKESGGGVLKLQAATENIATVAAVAVAEASATTTNANANTAESNNMGAGDGSQQSVAASAAGSLAANTSTSSSRVRRYVHEHIHHHYHHFKDKQQA